MNEHIASNIRLHRRRLSWTQEQLAEAADISTRTVQRAEEGRMNAETLMAIAGALGIDLEVLRLDPELLKMLARFLGVAPHDVTPEKVTAKIHEFKKDYVIVRLVVLTNSMQLQSAVGCSALSFDCKGVDSEGVADVAAELHQFLRDFMDIGAEIGPEEQREYFKSAFETVRTLNTMGFSVSVGVRNVVISASPDGSPRVPFSILVVVVAPTADALEEVAVSRQVQFGY